MVENLPHHLRFALQPEFFPLLLPLVKFISVDCVFLSFSFLFFFQFGLKVSSSVWSPVGPSVGNSVNHFEARQLYACPFVRGGVGIVFYFHNCAGRGL